MENLQLDRLSSKINEKYMFQVLKMLIKSYKIQLPVLLFLVVLHQKIFFDYNYLELHSTLSEQRFISQSFLF